MSKKKGIIRLVVLLAVIAFVVYTAVSGLGSDRSGSLNDISLGLDLRGGRRCKQPGYVRHEGKA